MFFFENNGKLLEVEDVGERASVAEVLIFDLVSSLIFILYCIWWLFVSCNRFILIIRMNTAEYRQNGNMIFRVSHKTKSGKGRD